MFDNIFKMCDTVISVYSYSRYKMPKSVPRSFSIFAPNLYSIVKWNSSSTRGNKDLLILAGYAYSQNKVSVSRNGLIHCECTERRNAKSCNARLTTMDQVEVGRLHAHTHPDYEKIRVLKIKSELKNRAINTAEKTRDILSISGWSRSGYISAMSQRRDADKIHQKHAPEGESASPSSQT